MPWRHQYNSKMDYDTHTMWIKKISSRIVSQESDEESLVLYLVIHKLIEMYKRRRKSLWCYWTSSQLLKPRQWTLLTNPVFLNSHIVSLISCHLDYQIPYPREKAFGGSFICFWFPSLCFYAWEKQCTKRDNNAFLWDTTWKAKDIMSTILSLSMDYY